MIMPLTVGIRAEDVTGQKILNAPAIPMDATVGEMLDGLVPQMHLPRKDSNGRPMTYHGRLEREGRHLNRSERVGDALRQDDRVVVQPNVDAGRGPE